LPTARGGVKGFQRAAFSVEFIQTSMIIKTTKEHFK